MSEKPHSCGGCDNRWGGENTAHCSACHLTFTGVKWFDFHQVRAGVCLTVAQLARKSVTENDWGYLGYRDAVNVAPRSAQRGSNGRFGAAKTG